MNFFRGKSELAEYFEDNELDEETTYGVDLETAFLIGKNAFMIEEA
mgnify:CR=1 FL=1